MATTSNPRSTRVRSPLMRALLPNVGGLLVLVAIGLLLWVFAAYISGGGGATSEQLAPTRLQLGSARSTAEIVGESGPIVFPDLGTVTGERTIVLDHTGDDPATGWVVYAAYPAGGDANCVVEQVVETRTFLDCDGNTIDVSELAAPPPGVNPVVEQERVLSIDLSGLSSDG